jgi:feruloyl esterase
MGPKALRGAKMLFVGGWADQELPPQNSVDYVKAVQERYWKAATDQFLRLFMVPGITHCGLASGRLATDQFDALGTLEGRVPKHE